MDPNELMRRGWTEGASGWIDNERIVDHSMAPVTSAIVEAAALDGAARLLDVGCGSGTLLAEARRRGVVAVGVDISPTMAQAARERVPEATVVVGDAQTDDLLAAAPGPPFDRVVSRFGVMFFADPTAAFRNLRAAAAPRAVLAAAVWRGPEENPVFTLGNRGLLDRLELPPPPPGAPGPTALADPDRTRRLLLESGWDAVELLPLDVTLDYGVDGSDGVEERLAMAMAGSVGRSAAATLRPTMTDAEWDAVLEELRGEVRGALTDGVVRIPGACWLVTARA